MYNNTDTDMSSRIRHSDMHVTIEDLEASRANNMEMTTRQTNGSASGDLNKTRERKRQSRELKRRSTLSEEYCFGHCGRLHQKLWFKIVLFLFLSALNMADLLSDWLLYSDVAFTQKGLVYGPPGQDIIIALLVFSIIGSVTFVFETINLGLEVFKQKGLVDIDIASAITIWLEDIPQIAINVTIAACRDEAISYFQIVKAAVVIIGVVIRIILTLLRYCSKKYLAEVHQHTPESRRHVATRAFIMIGLFLMCTGSITVFVFTQTYRAEDGSIIFEVPKSVLVGKYDDQRYFNNVSIYFNHQSFNSSQQADNINWIRMAGIDDVRNSTARDTILRYAFTETNSTISLLIADNIKQRNILETKECYSLNKTSNNLTQLLCPVNPDNSTYTQVVFALHYTPAARLLIFGDIEYNVRVRLPNGTFENEANFVETIHASKSTINKIFGVIHYYRTHPSANNNNHVLKTDNSLGFYQNDPHLIDIDQVWRTGFTGCKATGSLAPTIKKDLKVDDQWFF